MTQSHVVVMYTECAACVNLHGGFAQVRNVEPSPLQGVLVVADLPVGFSSNNKEVLHNYSLLPEVC